MLQPVDFKKKLMILEFNLVHDIVFTKYPSYGCVYFKPFVENHKENYV